MARWPVPTDPETVVAIARSPIDRRPPRGRYHRPMWYSSQTSSGTHCVHWMQTKQLTLKEVTAPSALRLTPCGRCYHR